MLLSAVLLLGSCKDDNDGPDTPPVVEPPSIGSIYVLNQGNFGSSNATLSVYNPLTKTVQADIFDDANGAAFGDSPTAMRLYKGKAFVTLAGSGKIYIINPKTGKLTGKITGLSSPNDIVFLSDTKAYVSNSMSSQIDIINPTTELKTGEIKLAEGQFADEFVVNGNDVYTNLWSYGKLFLKIDATQDKVVAQVEVGIQPTTILLDKNGKLWTLNDGGYEGGPIGNEPPSLVKVDMATFKVESRMPLLNKNFSHPIALSVDKLNILFVDGDLYKMPVTATAVPTTPLVDGSSQLFYGLGINPENGEIYLSDAIDYVQAGKVMRYDSDGKLLDTFKAGVSPIGFCFIPQ